MPDPLHPSDDELVSAYLDGEASADEIARVEASLELLAEVESWRGVAAQVASDPDPTTVDPAQRDAHIAAALAASGTAANVTALAPARRRPWYRQPVAAVAAVLLAVVIAVPLLANLGGGDAGRDVATSASDEATTDGAAATDPDERGAEADERFLAEEAGDGEAGDGAEDGAAAAPAESAEMAAGDFAAGLTALIPSTAIESFPSAADVAEAYDALRESADDGQGEGAPATIAASPFEADAEAATALPCVGLFAAEALVASIDGVGDVLVGTIAGETVVVTLDDSCQPLFPDE